MLDPHMSLGIAQVVFYVPVVPLAFMLMKRNGKVRPRMAWYPFIPFSILRLVGGILTIVYETQKDNIGVYIAALVMLNVGVIPLIISNLGLTRIILMDNYSHDDRARKAAVLLRLGFAAAIVLFVASGAMSGVENLLHVSRVLSVVGYVVFAVILAVLIAMQLFFRFTRQHEISPVGHKVLLACLSASPFLIIRTVYGFLSTTNAANAGTIWSPLLGSAVAFALMALLPEYIAICILFTTGFSIPANRDLPAANAAAQVKDQP